MTSKIYPTDLSNAEWHRLARLVPGPKPGVRPLKYARREILNAILYLVRTGCPWRFLPADLPPWRIVYHYFGLWTRSGWWQQLHDHLRAQVRTQVGRRPQPTAGIVDSQSVKMAPQAGERGCDVGKQTTGRKRHVLVDTLGLMWLLVVHPANLQDRDGAKLLLGALSLFCRRLRLIWADGAYGGALSEWVADLRQRAKLRLEIVKREAGAKGWQVLPKRWIVERTFGWLSRSRRLGRDYEVCIAHSEAMIYIAMSHLMLRRLHNKGTF